MRFSAIIPVYNGAKYIKSLAADLQAQTCKDFEAIFINDGSTDDTPALLQEVQKSANFDMKIISQPNKGVSAARNAGISAAEGEYITFIDIDDGIAPLFFACLNDLFKKAPSDFYILGLVRDRKDLSLHLEQVKSESKLQALDKYLFGKIKIGACGTVASQRLIRQNNILFPEGYKYGEDLSFVWQLLATAPSTVLTDTKLYYYRMNTSSAMHRFSSERLDAISVIEDLKVFFEEKEPKFAPSFKKYAVPRIRWSLLWQAAFFADYKTFKTFAQDIEMNNNVIRLIANMHEPIVALSSLIFCICPWGFYALARRFGKKRLS